MELIVKFVKFGVVGFSGLLIDFGLTYLLKEKFKVQKFVANAIGFLSAASSNYFLNRIWTFQSQNPEIAQEYGKFLFVSLIGLGINSLVLWVLNEKFKLNFYFAKLLAIVVTTFWNFVVNYLYTFT
ncbi:MAG: GtrA family protein [Vicingaceae bacterium]